MMPHRGLMQLGFVAAFVMAWAAVFVFYGMKKRLSVRENAFAFLLVLAFGINVSWIVAEELKLIGVTKEGLPYAAFLLFRSIYEPTVDVIVYNAVIGRRSFARLAVPAAAGVAAIAAGNGAMLWLGVFEYKQWNLLYEACRAASVMAAGYGALLLYRRAVRSGVSAG